MTSGTAVIKNSDMEIHMEKDVINLSSIAFQKFSNTLNNGYPTFSICLSDDIFEEGDIFKSILNDMNTINKSDYLKYLKGNLDTTKELLEIKYEDIVHFILTLPLLLCYDCPLNFIKILFLFI